MKFSKVMRVFRRSTVECTITPHKVFTCKLITRHGKYIGALTYNPHFKKPYSIYSEELYIQNMRITTQDEVVEFLLEMMAFEGIAR